jgi:antitoxin component HigA of HigAB toxin-antitoxin module
MSQFNGLTSSGLIDYLRESTEAALDLSKNLTAAHTPGDFLTVWTKFAEGQYSAAEKLTYQLTGQTITGAKNFGFGSYGFGTPGTGKRQGNGAAEPSAATTAAVSATTEETENAAAIAELQDQADAFRAQMDELSAQVAALADRLGSQAADVSNRLSAQIAALSDKIAALEGRPLRVKCSFGEPPHTGWTPSKVVVLGNDGNGNLVELPSTIEEGGFRYTGAPSFWIAIG